MPVLDGGAISPLDWARLATASRQDLLAAILFQHEQLVIHRRAGKKPRLTPAERSRFAFFAAIWSRWRDFLVIVQPATVLRWQKQWRGIFWSWVCRKRGKALGRPPTAREVIALIQWIFTENPTMGALKVQLELLFKLDISLSPATVRKYKPSGPADAWSSWPGFLKRHTGQILAVDFITVGNPLKPFYVFTVLHHATRKIVHTAATKKPTLDWIKQQLETAFSQSREKPRFIIHDNDRLFGQYPAASRQKQRAQTGVSFRSHLDKWLTEVHGVRGIPTPYHAPKANSLVERYQGSLRREVLNHYLFFRNAAVLTGLVQEYAAYYNQFRVHQGIMGIPDPHPSIDPVNPPGGKVVSISVLDGLIHHYRWAA